MTARTTGKDNDDSKDDDSKDNGNNGKDDNNIGGNKDSGGGGGGGGNIGGEVGKVARSVAWLVACSLPLVAWCLHTVGIVQIHLGINLFWSKFYSGCLINPNKFYSILYLDLI
jgi:hypothetical protein